MNITDDLLKKFEEISGDSNPLHVNKSYALERGFKDRVAYGNILGLMVSQLGWNAPLVTGRNTHLAKS